MTKGIEQAAIACFLIAIAAGLVLFGVLCPRLNALGDSIGTGITAVILTS